MTTAAVLLGPGQGAQTVGMGQAWATASPAAKAVFDEADAALGDALGAPLSRICFEGPAETLNRTDVSQPAIFTCSIASARAMADSGLNPVAAAGLSLGEYTALCLSGVFDFASGLQLVAARGRLMQGAAEASESGMVALIGASEEEARGVCDAAAGDGVLVCANFNAPGQIVLSGSSDACARAVAVGTERGFRCTALSVAGAFHSPLMQPAADAMGDLLAGAEFSSPTIPVWSNVTGQPHLADDMELLKQRLVEQIVQPVRWTACCESLIAAVSGDGSAAVPGVDLASTDGIEYHELAPGAVLRGLMRRIDRQTKVTSHDEP